MRIAIIGGTGKEGRGLAMRWSRAGHQVMIGSRDEERARARATELSAAGYVVTGGSNAWAAGECEVAVLSVPYSAHEETLRALKDLLLTRVVVDIAVPLQPPKVTEVHLPPLGAAALEAQAILGEQAPLVAAMHHLSSVHLSDIGHPLDTDVLVCSDHARAREVVIGLMHDLGARGLDAGPLRNAIALESLTPVLLYLNKHYKHPGTGVRFTGLFNR
jgi:NADPH-dependent F420 reductase